MKSFLDKVLEWKASASLMFTGSMLVYLVAAFIWDVEITKMIVLSILILTLVGSFIQYLAFTDAIIKNVKYSWRIVIFTIPFFTLILACAYFFKWVPMEYGFSPWLIFGGVFIFILLAMTLGFEVYYKLTGKKYDGLLGQYRKAKEEKDN